MAYLGGRLLGVVCLICVIYQAKTEDGLPKGLKCLSCTGRLSLLDCNEIELCSHDDQVCFIEEILDSLGEVVINAGCRKMAECDSRGCFNTTTRNRRDVIGRAIRSTTGKPLCHHCCDTELCNMFGCSGTKEIDALTGTRCVVCDLVDHPKHCHVVQTCDPGEYCYTSLKVRSTGSGTVKRYDTGCMKQNVCDLLDKTHQQQSMTSGRKRRSYVELYSECCHSHMCNRDIPLALDLPSRESGTYKCPEGNKQAGLTSAAPGPVYQEVCEDKIDNCADYGEDYICHSDYVPWAKLNCNKFCKFCVPCEDTITECSEYGYDYICTGDYIPWAMLNCKRFCNLCDGEVPTTSTAIQTTPLLTTTPEPCEDVIDNCADYGRDYICSEDYAAWSAINCRQFCNLCTAQPVTSTELASREEPCEDKIAECGEYGYDYICQGDYNLWSEINCRKFCNLCKLTTQPDTTTKTTEVQTAVTTKTQSTTDQPCIDVNTQCAEYGADYICVGDYIPWAKINCRKFCNLCHATTTTPTPLPSTIVTTKTLQTTEVPCIDVNFQCAEYGADYICVGDYIPWAEINCRKFCNLCHGSTTTFQLPSSSIKATTLQTTEVPCIDVNFQCAEYGADYICVGDYIPWSKINCRKFCNLCHETSTTSTTSPTSSTKAATTLQSTEVPCIDVDFQCAEYGADYICVDKYIQWAEINCRKFCNLCHESTTTIQNEQTTKTASTNPPLSSTYPPQVKTTVSTSNPTSTSVATQTQPNKSTSTSSATNPETTSSGHPKTSTPVQSVSTTIPTRKSTIKSSASVTRTNTVKPSTTPIRTSTVKPSTTPIRTSTVKPSTTPIRTSTVKPSTTPIRTSTVKPSTTPIRTITVKPSTTPIRTSTVKSSTIPTKPSTMKPSSIPTIISTDKSSISSTKPGTVSVPTSSPPNSTKPVIDTSTSSERPSTASSTLQSSSTRPTPAATQPTQTITSSPTDTESLTTEALSTTEKPCIDTIDCSAYSVKLACHGEFVAWAYTHCPRHCGFCTDGSATTTLKQTTKITTSTEPTTTTRSTKPTTTTTTTLQTTVTTTKDPVCYDKIDCSGIKSRCGDTDQHAWLHENCRKTCDLCQEVSVCEDEIHECAAMALYICELGVSPELKPQCKKTCKLC